MDNTPVVKHATPPNYLSSLSRSFLVGGVLQVSSVALPVGGVGVPGASRSFGHRGRRFVGERAGAAIPVRNTVDR